MGGFAERGGTVLTLATLAWSSRPGRALGATALWAGQFASGPGVGSYIAATILSPSSQVQGNGVKAVAAAGRQREPLKNGVAAVLCRQVLGLAQAAGESQA